MELLLACILSRRRLGDAAEHVMHVALIVEPAGRSGIGDRSAATEKPPRFVNPHHVLVGMRRQSSVPAKGPNEMITTPSGELRQIVR